MTNDNATRDIVAEALVPLPRPARRRHHLQRVRDRADVPAVPQDAGGDEARGARCRRVPLGRPGEARRRGSADYYKRLAARSRQPEVHGTGPRHLHRCADRLRKPTNLKALTSRIDQARLVLGPRGRAGQSLRGPAGEERRGQEIRCRAVFHAASADRLHRAPDEAAAGRDRAGPGGGHGRLSRRCRPLHQGSHRRSLQADASSRHFQRHNAFVGAGTCARHASALLMNLLLHGIEGGVELGDTLSPGRRATAEGRSGADQSAVRHQEGRRAANALRFLDHRRHLEQAAGLRRAYRPRV